MSSRRYTSPTRTAAAARTRQKLVRSAVGLLKSPDSLKKLSLESVAREAGVSRLTVYNQFGSRKGLLEAVFDDRARLGGIQQLADAMAHPDPYQGLARLIEIFCHFWDFNRQIVTAVLGAGGTFILFKLVNGLVGLRVDQEDESVGLDLSQHGERAYNE